MSSITYRIATGRDAGCKVVTLQTLPGHAGSLEGEAARSAASPACRRGGRSTRKPQAGKAVPLHHAPGDQREAAVDSAPGQVRYQLKTPWRNGTTHVEWDPVDFIAKLAALVPPPRAHLTRFHGVFAERRPARTADAIGARQAA